MWGSPQDISVSGGLIAVLFLSSASGLDGASNLDFSLLFLIRVSILLSFYFAWRGASTSVISNESSFSRGEGRGFLRSS